MRASLTQRSEWSPAKAVPTITTVVLSLLAVLPLRIPDYAAVVPLLNLAAVYYWTLYRPEWLPPISVFACGLVFDLLTGAPLGVTSLLLLLARSVVLSQRRFFVNRLFPFVWSGFTLLAAAAIGMLWVIGSALEGTMLDMRAAVLQWVLTVAAFPAASYLLMRIQRGSCPPIERPMQREVTRSKHFGRRAVLLGGAQLALLAALAGRMYYLQVVQSGRYAVLADENRVNLRLLAPPRGRIVDRFGVALATNAQTYRIVLIAEQAGDIDATLKAIDQLVTLTDADRHRVLRDIRRKHSFVPIVVRGNLAWDDVARIEVNVPELPGVMIEEGLNRAYPFGETASHVLGYVAAVSEKELTGDPLLELPDFRIGKSGVEKLHDLDLRGVAGTSQVEVNAFGRVVRELQREEGKPGAEIVLTLDMALQDLATRRCAAEQSAACVLLDAITGEVLALASAPGFDPIAFGSGLSAALWHDITTNPRNPLRNKAVAGAYAPGSTFKPMVALAGLESGVITPDTRVACPGHYALGNAVWHCWRKGGHGVLTVREAIKHSCDCFFYETAHRLGIDRIAAMARRFGLGNKLDFDIPGEVTGNIPTKDWNLATYGVAWQLGETISAGIGQSKVTATPLQLATMAARLVTNRAVVPRITRAKGIMRPSSTIDSEANFPALNVSARDLKLVLDGMYAVVNEQGGTAYSMRIPDPALAMGGKSGTSQVRHISAAEREHGLRKIKEVPWIERDHALFISFAPVSAPRYVCAVIVEHGGESAGGGSAVAAPMCRDLLKEAQLRDPARRIPNVEFIADSGPAARRG